MQGDVHRVTDLSSKHDICLQLAGGEERVFERIKHTPEAIEEWAQALYQRLGV